MVKRSSWLSITPEPERELPGAVATLRRGASAPAPAVAAERARIERLLLRGTQRRWLSYLHEVTGLIAASGHSGEASVVEARRRARSVIVNHHNLLLALPGPGARKVLADQAELDRTDVPHAGVPHMEASR
jgi:hypothetical protein